MKHLIFSLFLVFVFNASAQTNVYLSFPPKVGGSDLVLGTTVQDLNGVEMSIDNFYWYLSNVHIIHDGGQDLDLSDTVMIVKDTAHNLMLGNFNVTNIESINFGVGVPQSLNHLDISTYPLDHPLSWQNPSMHWGWTAGYKLFLCDGWGDASGDGTPETVFQIHTLGDANYKYVSMPVVQTVNPTNITVVINCNLDEWLWGANPGTVGTQHGETGINASVMNNVNARPVFEVPGDAGVTEMVEEGNAFFSVIGESIKLTWENVAGATTYAFYNSNGQLIANSSNIHSAGEVVIGELSSGVYFFHLFDDQGKRLNSIKVLK